jgi:hypothetical protein
MSCQQVSERFIASCDLRHRPNRYLELTSGQQKEWLPNRRHAQRERAMMSVPIIILVPLYTFALIGMVLLFRQICGGHL